MVQASKTNTWDDASLITLPQAKANLKIDHDLDDAEIAAMIKAAYIAVEDQLNVILLNSTIKYKLLGSNSNFELLLNDISSFKLFGAVTAVDTSGITHTPTTKTMRLNGDAIEVSSVKFDSDVDVNHWFLSVTYAPELINDAINEAVFLTITHMYENRNAVVIGATSNTLPMGVKNLLSTYRIIPI